MPDDGKSTGGTSGGNNGVTPPAPPIPAATDPVQQTSLISIKIPPFWNNRPDLWFLQIETQFRLKNITASNTKYDYLVASLNNQTMESVADVLITPPAQNKYENLKKVLLERNRDSEERRLDALLNKVELGDMKPSELYRSMESLASGNDLVNSPLVMKLWLNRLPSNIRVCLMAVENSQTQSELFALADRLHHSSAASHVAQINSQVPSSDSELLQKLIFKIERLETNFSRSNNNFNRASRSLSRDRFGGRPRSQSRSKSGNSSICWFHKKFGNNARNCSKQSCTFQSEGNKSTKN